MKHFAGTLCLAAAVCLCGCGEQENTAVAPVTHDSTTAGATGHAASPSESDAATPAGEIANARAAAAAAGAAQDQISAQVRDAGAEPATAGPGTSAH